MSHIIVRIHFNLPKDLSLFKPCFNIAPGKDVPVIVCDGERNVMHFSRQFANFLAGGALNSVYFARRIQPGSIY
jgi:hypothetical protein